MIPLVDIHCHLLAGLDDGPRTPEDALEMCRIAYADGIRIIAAGAHQNDHYPENTPDC
jgi:protein-tyrosine phosphatase